MARPPAEVIAELRWVIDRAEEHLGPGRAGRYLRKFYPWYGERLAITKAERHELVTAPGIDAARTAIDRLETGYREPAAA